MILLSSNIISASFTSEELASLEQWVTNGGVLMSPAIRTSNSVSRSGLSTLFGVDCSSAPSYRKDRPLLTWNPEFINDKELEYIDEPEELTTSVGLVKTYANV